MPANKNKNRTVLVTGATGHQGGAALRHLRQKGFAVRALTRDPDQPKARGLTGQGVEVIRGNLDEQSSLGRVMDGAFGVHSVQNAHEAGVEGEIRQGINVADTAKRSDIEQFVYSSVASADRRTGIPHFDSKFRVEEHIRGTGLHFTFVRPVFFMDNWLGMRQQIEQGALSLPLSPATRLQMVAVDNIGGVVAMAFEHPGKWRDRVFELAGDELSMAEIAQVFGRISGRDVRYVQIPWDEFEQQAGKEMTTMYRWFEDTGYHVDIGAARQQYHGLLSFEQWIQSNWHSAVRTAG